MTHTVKSGETLSKIAKVHGITLAKLLDANPRFKPDPNRIRIGDILNVPSDQSTATVATPSVQPQPTAPVAEGRVLGKLSEKFETSGRGPGTVSTGIGDPGGVSYGSYQMTSKPKGGRVGTFVSQADFPFRDKFAGLAPGTAEFTSAWKKLASSDREEFQRVQHDFIKRTHFDVLVAKIVKDDGFNVLTRSAALQDVIWSTAVQHGPKSKIPHAALTRVDRSADDPDFDERLIIAIYEERGRKRADGVLAHFTKASPAVRKGVEGRFKQELKDALKMLADELAG